MKYQLHHGIAACIEATREDGVSWTIIHGYEHDDSTCHSWPRGHGPLPQAVKDACAPWFAEVFAVPIGERQAIIDKHRANPIVVQTD